MTVGQEFQLVSYDLRNSKGTIILPEACLSGLANLAVPGESDIFTESETQRYPVGTQLRKNGRLYRYSKAGADILTGCGFFKVNSIIVAGKVGNSLHSGFEGNFYAAVAAGATSFKIADTAAVKNEYEGARLVVGNDTTAIFAEYRVIGNDVSNGTTTTLYIAPPGFRSAATTSDSSIGISLNPYSEVKSGLVLGCAYYSAIGIARFPVHDNYWFWLQTAGFCGMTGASTWPGQTAYQRDVMCNTDGSLIGITAATYLYQRVGHLLSGSASDYGTTFFNLQLDQ